MASQVMRITLKAYDHQLIDASAKKIIETVKKNGAQVSGPVPLPTKKEVVTLSLIHIFRRISKRCGAGLSFPTRRIFCQNNLLNKNVHFL